MAYPSHMVTNRTMSLQQPPILPAPQAQSGHIKISPFSGLDHNSSRHLQHEMAEQAPEVFIILTCGHRRILARRPPTLRQLLILAFHEFNLCPRYPIMIKMNCPFGGDREVELLSSAYPMVRNGDELRITEIRRINQRVCTDCAPQY